MQKIDFNEVKRIANGMLSASTYEKIYCMANQSSGDIVEVGTAHGAATICLAASRLNKNGTVYSFEKILGGSREKYGSIEKNVEIIQSNYRHFGVSEKIKQFIGDVVEESSSIESIPCFSMLVLDADGRLDRDFCLFYDRLEPGGVIIIDDCDDRIKVKFKSGLLHVDQKHRLTNLFIKKFEDMGYLEPIELLGNTYFGRKPTTNLKTIADLGILDTSAIYAHLVFSDIDYIDALKSRAKYYLSRLKSKIKNLVK